MKAVILAAGMATRLRPLTDACPKCLLDVGGTCILQRAMDNLLACSISEIVIVTGYKEEMIRDFVSRNFPDLDVTFIYNDRYASTNNAYSLLLGEHAAGDDFLLLDSDIIFQDALIACLLEESEKPCIAVNRHACGEEEMKISMDASGYVTDIGKHIIPDDSVVESIGFEVFDKKSARTLFGTLRKRIVAEKRENEFYEASFKEMIERGTEFKTVDTTHFPAIEIDSPEDLQTARTRILALMTEN